MADGCGGQNKNTIMITMILYWLALFAPPQIEHMELIFSVTDHSFIPLDRVFGRIERKLKKREMILNPDEMILLKIITLARLSMLPQVLQF